LISRLQRKRADQEFAVVKLQNTRLFIGLSECGRVLCKADDAAKLRHCEFLNRCFCAMPKRRLVTSDALWRCGNSMSEPAKLSMK